VVAWAVIAVACITPVGLFVLAALWVITRSPNSVRLRLSRFLGLEIEGGGTPSSSDQSAVSARPSGSVCAGRSSPVGMRRNRDGGYGLHARELFAVPILTAQHPQLEREAMGHPRAGHAVASSQLTRSATLYQYSPGLDCPEFSSV
jgi:hypothetical protein